MRKFKVISGDGQHFEITAEQIQTEDGFVLFGTADDKFVALFYRPDSVVEVRNV
jgi:hypothetical protein